MSIEFDILALTAGFELVCMALLLNGFREFRRDPETQRISLLRLEVAAAWQAKAARRGTRNVQEKVI